MGFVHKLMMYAALGFVGLTLLIPGLVELLKPSLGSSWLIASQVDARSHLRGLNAMMAAIGLIALWACRDLAHSRALVLALGLVLALVAAARIYSLWIDGLPARMTLLYLASEILLAGLFLYWPPPKV